MDSQLTELLEDLYLHGREHDQGQTDRLHRLRNLEPDSARLLALLIRASAPKRLLELGTSNGYSTIWLADAARALGAQMTSVEIDAKRCAQAGENLRRAGLEQQVELRVADAGDVLAGSQDGEWNFIFLDAERPAYSGYWPDLVRVLAPGGLLAVDNVISHADQIAEFRELTAKDTRFLQALSPTGAGVLLLLRQAD
ncbi:MAG TPA: O-methyltransferase [Solirubrobacteraceae bacterium]|jgi:predicted O-methyltransferase YrrM